MNDDALLLGTKQLDTIKEVIQRLGAARQAKVPFLGMALSAIEAKDYEQALGMFERAIALGPHPLDYVLRAQMLARPGRFAEAKSAVNHAVELDPDNPDARRTRAHILEHVHDLDGALADLDYVAIHLEPNDVTVHVSRGMLLDDLNRLDEALMAFDRAVELDPNDEFVHVSRGMILDRLERFGEACAAFDRALEIDPCNRAAGFMRESYPPRPEVPTRKINQESRYGRRYTPEVDTAAAGSQTLNAEKETGCMPDGDRQFSDAAAELTVPASLRARGYTRRPEVSAEELRLKRSIVNRFERQTAKGTSFNAEDRAIAEEARREVRAIDARRRRRARAHNKLTVS